MATANELYQYVTDTGVIIPDTSAVQDYVEGTYREVFGNGVDLTAETVGGRLVERDTSALTQTIGVVAQNANQFNPHYATGVYLDHLANMFGFSRQPATYTSVYARLSGTAGTVVTAGALAKTESGDTFVCEADVSIGDNGYGDGWFIAESAGSVRCGVGELNSVQTNIEGWLKITNLYGSVDDESPEFATVIGSAVETDAHLRDRLVTSVWSGVGFVQSIRSRVADVAGVKSCVVLENNGVQARVERGVTIPGHSVCVCVDGGDNEEVAQAIYASRSAGCGYVSPTVEEATNVTVSILDESSGINHQVVFLRQPQTLQGISVELKASTSGYASTATLASSVQAAVDAYLDGLPIGFGITDYSVAQAITEALPSVKVLSTVVKTSGDTPKPIDEYEVPAYMKFKCREVKINPNA